MGLIKSVKIWIVVLISFFLIFPVISYAGWLIYHKPAFNGKVIDAETKEPIEGAVVVAIYNKWVLGFEPQTSYVDIKEFLTDKNGEFYIPSYTTIIQPFSWEAWVRFIIFKPGYGSFRDYLSYHKFIIWALPEELVYSYKLSEILKKRVEEKWKKEFEEFKKALEKEGKKTYFTRKVEKYLPIIPMKDAKKRLQKLDIPYFTLPDDIDVENVRWLNMIETNINLMEKSDYMVIGLPKLKTREERRKNIPSLPSYIKFLKKQKNLIRLRNEEEENIGLQKTDPFKAREFILKEKGK